MTFVYRLLLWTCVIITIIIITTVKASQPEVREYCKGEDFNATCGPSDVVVVHSARYGLMKLGRCLHEGQRNIGCGADVRANMDWMCSGVRSCGLRVPDTTMQQIKECQKDANQYLEASYECVSSNRHVCNVSTEQPLRTGTGYLLTSASDFEYHEKTSGTQACPWVLQMQPGQRINLTIFNFQPEQIIQGWGSCSGMKILIQDGKNPASELSLCRESQREKHLFSSESHRISIYMKRTEKPNMGMFLIKYQVVGCPDIGPFPNAQATMEEGKVTVRCQYTSAMYHLVCSGSKWIGSTPDCPPEPTTKVTEPTTEAQELEDKPTTKDTELTTESQELEENSTKQETNSAAKISIEFCSMLIFSVFLFYGFGVGI